LCQLSWWSLYYTKTSMCIWLFIVIFIYKYILTICLHEKLINRYMCIKSDITYTQNWVRELLKQGVMVFNAFFNNISAISWRSDLLVKKTGVRWENHRPVASHWITLSHNVVSSTPRLSGIRTRNVISDRRWQKNTAHTSRNI
jgi:hypothetical protein